jgi:prepilin-type N-terminal cleavage/methylation domain-containing protein
LKPSQPNARLRAPNGMTLVEMMVATTITLIIMGIVAQLFGILGQGVTESRASMEMRSSLRAVAQRLRLDLGGATVKTLPPVAPEAEQGYLEIVEGLATETAAALVADCDDVLMFTTRSVGEPFVGLFTDATGPSTISSPVAEVAWFCQPTGAVIDGQQLHTLYRRQLLVVEYVGRAPFLPGNSYSGAIPGIYDSFDLSLRDESGVLIPNSLRDLTKRENRFFHKTVPSVNYETLFPFDAYNPVTNPTAASTAPYFSGAFPPTSTRAGQDVILENVVAFDVKVFAPAAVLNATSATATGEYVDLTGTPSVTAPGKKLSLPTYDTWSLHYEFNGIDEDRDGSIDEGTNGLDDDSDGVADEEDERETNPPIRQPLRGIEIRIRCYEPSSRQIRQVTVRHTFVPH